MRLIPDLTPLTPAEHPGTSSRVTVGHHTDQQGFRKVPRLNTEALLGLGGGMLSTECRCCYKKFFFGFIHFKTSLKLLFVSKIPEKSVYKQFKSFLSQNNI